MGTGSTQKRILWLPHDWRSDKRFRARSEHFSENSQGDRPSPLFWSFTSGLFPSSVYVLAFCLPLALIQVFSGGGDIVLGKLC